MLSYSFFTMLKWLRSVSETSKATSTSFGTQNLLRCHSSNQVNVRSSTHMPLQSCRAKVRALTEL